VKGLVLLEVIAPVEKYNLNPDLDTTNRWMLGDSVSSMIFMLLNVVI